MTDGPDAIRILFAGGGTAGHLMPALNIAGEMIGIDKRVKPLFVGKRGGIEREIVARFGYEIEEIEVIGMRRTPMGMVRFLLNWRKSLDQAMEIVKRFQPGAIVGTGGYVSAPVIRAGHKAGKIVFLQEQNSLPGLAARSMAKYADTIFIAYDSARKYLKASRCKLTGNPIRSDIAGREKDSSIKKFGLDPARKTLLVLGGSSGAAGINQKVAELVRGGFFPGNWQLLWQTGKRDYESLRRHTMSEKRMGILLPFIDDMPAAYASADLVLSRAGAMALSEIAAAGLPSLLVPFPHATGDHQRQNAASLEKMGGAVVVDESEINIKLESVLNDLFNDESRRNKMSVAAFESGKPDAARVIAQDILDRINEIQKN